jgi:hypothetical protein
MLTIQEQNTAITCSSCGSEENVIVRHDQNSLPTCATCSGKEAKWHEAHEHLKASLEPHIKPWREHWIVAGIDAGIVSDITNDVLEALVWENNNP